MPAATSKHVSAAAAAGNASHHHHHHHHDQHHNQQQQQQQLQAQQQHQQPPRGRSTASRNDENMAFIPDTSAANSTNISAYRSNASNTTTITAGVATAKDPGGSLRGRPPALSYNANEPAGHHETVQSHRQSLQYAGDANGRISRNSLTRSAGAAAAAAVIANDVIEEDEDNDGQELVLRANGAMNGQLKDGVEHRKEHHLRHGFGDQYNSEEYLALLEQVFYMYHTDKRHETGGNPKEPPGYQYVQEWRMKDRLKTVSAALVLCLNIGVDPPDVVKTNPCAKLECWVDTTAHPSPKALEMIGKNLQTQYETLSIRTRYKQYLDPSVEETKKFCCSLRRNAKDERILFHYNGHGVPKPTASGEIWVFNKNYTQYIPISLYDLQSWLGAPSLFVYDCSDAGNIVANFNRFIEKHEQENKELRDKDPNAMLPVSYNDCIQLAACGSKEALPMNPDLPADLFTCCLTTPIEIAIRFFVLQNPLPHHVTLEMALKIPGRLQERRTPLGELNWIFTAITDTIAWNTLPRPLFKKLFRQDLMVAALFRNFLLAQRIMRVHQCHPISSPPLPDTHHHPLWQSWDLAVEMVLAQLPQLLRTQEQGGQPYEYEHSQFFTEQLTAFEVYLTQGAVDRSPPDQLPIVLQVLLSQVHRLRALILLSKFLDLGPWAVNLALSIGIFPYVLKLLQSAAAELKPVMVFIWARLLAVDPSCQGDLLKDNGYSYFTQILSPNSGIPISNASEHRAMCAFILSIFCRGFHQGQVVCMSPGVLGSCLSHFNEPENPLLRQWACLCISQLWYEYPEAKWAGLKEEAHLKLCTMLVDPVPEVRAAALYALTTLIGMPDNEKGVIAAVDAEIATQVLSTTGDGSSMVRKEIVVYFSAFAKRYESKFLVAAYEALTRERDQLKYGPSKSSKDRIDGVADKTIYAGVWTAILIMSADPHMEVSQNACIIIDCILKALLLSPLGEPTQELMEEIQWSKKVPLSELVPTAPEPAQNAQGPNSPSATTKGDGYFSLSLRRTASIAASLKTLAFGAGSAASTPNEPNSTAKTPNGRPVSGGVTSLQPEWNKPPNPMEAGIGGTAGYHRMKQPTSKHFKKRKEEDVKIPLKSTFFEWSMEYFREPQMRPTEADEPGSVDYNHRLWRRTRNEKTIMDTQPQKERAVKGKWDHPCGLFPNGAQPCRIVIHQFENHMVAVDDRDGVSVWDWQKQVRMNQFSNGNPAGTRVTEVKLLNEDDVALLMTGSGDGVVRIYKNYENKSTELVSAWRALTDLLPSNRSSGLIAEWQQGRGTLLVGGDMKVIRVWDAPREMCLTDIPARSGSCITSLTSDQVAGNIFVAGFGDGAVRVYDRRLNPRDAMVIAWKEHKAWVTKVHMQRGGLRELISGSTNGDVKLWDIRNKSAILDIRAHRTGMRSMAVHEHAPVIATGSLNHEIKIWNTNGSHLSTFKPYSNFLLQSRSSPISVLTFHPHHMMLACATLGDYHVNMFACDPTYKVSS